MAINQDCNSIQQTTIFRWQTMIFFATAIFALGALIIPAINLHEDNLKSTLQKQLQDRDKEIYKLHIQLSQLKNSIYHPTEAKKTLLRKP